MNKKLKLISILGLALAVVLMSGVNSASATLTLDATSIIGSAALSLSGAAGSVITIGNTAQTGTINVGSSTGALTLNLGAGNSAKTINIGTGTAIDTINIGTGGTGVDVIRIGDSVADVEITDAQWGISTTGAVTGLTGITSAMITDATIVNADIGTAAGIALSKLASGTDGQIIVANVSGVPTYVAMSGDITITNAGVSTIGASKVTNTMLAGSIDLTTKVTGILPTANGGTGIAYFTAAGPTVARVYTFPDAAATILTTNAAVTVAQGGTGATTLTGLLQGNGTSAITAITNSSTAGQVLRVTGASTYAWGALNLASSTDAVTGILGAVNGGTGNGFFAVTGPTTATKTFTFPDASGTVTVLGNTSTGSGSVVLATSPTLVTPSLGVATGTSFAASGAITTASPSASFGYVTGAGCAVTQAASRTTGVTCNGNSGAITTNNASLAAEATAKFTVTNTSVAIGDVIIVSQRSGSDGGGTIAHITTVAAGSFEIAIHNGNVAAGTAETGAIIINFAVIKAVSN